MFGLFSPRSPIDADELEWLFAVAQWLIVNRVVAEPGADPLITPASKFFPTSPFSGNARASELFDQTLTLAGMTDRECALEPGEAPRSPALGGAMQQSWQDNTAAGTFQHVRDAGTGRVVPLIRYNPALLTDPVSLVATFAHELAHVRLHELRGLPPGGRDLEELATDFTAVFMGFGIFLANSAKSFSAYQHFDVSGWQTRRQGYLSEAMLVTAFAMYELLAGRDPMAAAPWLKAYLASDLKRAVKYLQHAHPNLIDDVMAVDLAEYAG